MMNKDEYINKLCSSHTEHTSSEDIDIVLQKIGVSAKFKFSHNYKLPQERSYEDYDRHLCELHYELLGNEDKDEVINVLKRETKLIADINPELKDIELKNEYRMMDLLLGISFKYAPKDIKWFVEVYSLCSLEEKENYQKEDELIGKEYGVWVSHILCPENKEKLIELLKTVKKG